MKKKLCVVMLVLGACSFLGCSERIELAKEIFERIPERNLKIHWGLRPGSELDDQLKDEILEELQERRDEFAEENKDESIRLQSGLAIMDKTFAIIGETFDMIREQVFMS